MKAKLVRRRGHQLAQQKLAARVKASKQEREQKAALRASEPAGDGQSKPGGLLMRSLKEKLREKDPAFSEFLEGADKKLLEIEDLEDLEDDEDDEADAEVNGKTTHDEEVESEEEDSEAGEEGEAGEAGEEGEEEGEEDEEGEEEGEEGDAAGAASDEEAGSADDADARVAKPRRVVVKTEVTAAMVKRWKATLTAGLDNAMLKEVVAAFRSAVHFGDEGGEENEQCPYTFTTGHVFNLVMQFCLQHLDRILRRHAAGGQEAADSAKKTKSGADRPDTWAHWRKHQPSVKSFLLQSLHFLNKMSDSSLTLAVLRQLHRSLGFFYVFPKLGPKLLKALLRVWSEGISKDVTLLSYAMVREMAIHLPYPFIEHCLKGLYLSYATACRFTSRKMLEHVVLMSSCVVDICGVDLQVAYQHAFVYIRQLAIHLRNALHQSTEAHYRQVYNWQYINCLRVWAQVLCTHARSDTAPLRQLCYPLIQVTLGTARLLPNIRFAPLRFQCARIVNQLSVELGYYTPVAPLLLETFGFSDLSKTPTGDRTERVLDWAVLVKVSKADAAKRSYQTAMVRHAFFLLAEHLNAFAYSIAFPELAVPTVIALRKLAKTTKVVSFQKQAKRLLSQIEIQAKWVAQKREGEEMSPADMKAIDDFLAADQEAKTAPFSKWFANEVVTMRREEARGREEAGEIEADDDDASEDEKVEKKGKKSKKRKADAKEGGASKEETKGHTKKTKKPKSLPQTSELPDEVGEFALSDLEE